MSTLTLPQSYLVREENAKREEMVADHMGRAANFALALEARYPECDLVMAHDGADAPDLIPGYWHVRRRNGGITKDSYMPITDAQGGFAEPGQHHLDRLEERDLWKSGAIERIYDRIRQKEAAAERAQLLLREQQRDEFAADFRAARRVAGENLDARRWGRG